MFLKAPDKILSVRGCECKPFSLHAAPPFLMCVTFQEEIGQKSLLRLSWKKLIRVSERVTDALRNMQGKYKKQFIGDVKVNNQKRCGYHLPRRRR